jgi:pterin-4a-carbinolamine dehydratase
MSKLTGQQIADEGLDGWAYLLGGLQTRIHTKNFATGLSVVNAIGAAAEEMNHHPDLNLRYTHVDVRLTSHDERAVTDRDIRLGRAISSIAADTGVQLESSNVSRLELARGIRLRQPDRHHQPTGQVTAAVAVMITMRAFELLDALGAVLAAHEAVSVHQVTWHVDWDNPAWQDVRAAAIQAAIRKGRDYAAALGGSLCSVQPTLTEDGRRAPALRFGEPRVMALAGALSLTLSGACGLTSKSLRALTARLPGADYSASQMTYDLRRLRLNGLIRRIEHTHTYLLTPDGQRIAVFYTKLYNRLLRPLAAADQPQAPSELRRALAVIDHHVDDYMPGHDSSLRLENMTLVFRIPDPKV